MKSMSRVKHARDTLMMGIARNEWEGDKLQQCKNAVDTLQWVLDDDPVYAPNFPPSLPKKEVQS